jgi:hypothetical protein
MPKLDEKKVKKFLSKLPTKNKEEEEKEEKGAWSRIKEMFASEAGKNIGKSLSKRGRKIRK